MTEKEFFKIRLFITVLVTLAIWSLLAWNYFHGGVAGHHLLARKDMPTISNWWGGLLLPLLTWFLLFRIQRRFAHARGDQRAVLMPPINVIYGFGGALLFGVLLSTFYTLGYSDIPGYMVNCLFIVALFFPIYRAECLLGFVFGMTFTFGAVLPTVVGSVFALIGAVLYLFVRSFVLKFINSFA
jgi:hypothetical protein